MRAAAAGTLLTSLGCDLAKPRNKLQESLPEEPVAEVVVQQPAPQVVQTRPTPPAPEPAVQPPQQVKLQPGWTPEKVATMEQLKREIQRWGASGGGCLARAEFNRFADTIDPILVGKNVVFTPRWLEYVGAGKPLTRQQFEVWRDRTDKVYESYEELTGRTPHKGRIIVSDLQPASKFTTSSTRGHAHSNTTSLFCINYNHRSFKTLLQEIASHGSFGFTTMHEMAHLFATKALWNLETESVADLLVSYPMETIPWAQYGGGDTKAINPNFVKTVGIQHRQRRYQSALNNFNANKIQRFNEAYGGAVYDMYLYGLIDKVGWDTYKKVYRSYDDKGFKPNIYKGSTFNGDVLEQKTARVRDLFDRIEHFSGKPGVLRTLPDRGALLDRHFNVQVLERNLL